MLLKSYGNPFEAQMAADLLVVEGIPATANSLNSPSIYVGFAGETQVWLEDGKLMDDPKIRLRIEELLADQVPLDESDAERITQMPLVEE